MTESANLAPTSQRRTKVTFRSRMTWAAVFIVSTSVMVVAIAKAQTPGRNFSGGQSASTSDQANASAHASMGTQANSGIGFVSPKTFSATDAFSTGAKPAANRHQQAAIQSRVGSQFTGSQFASSQPGEQSVRSPRLGQNGIRQAGGIASGQQIDPLYGGGSRGSSPVIQATADGSSESDPVDFPSIVTGESPATGPVDPVSLVGSAGDLISFSYVDTSGKQVITVINASKQAMSVYYVDKSGIRLLSSRAIDADFNILFNATSPLPDEIRQLGPSAR